MYARTLVLLAFIAGAGGAQTPTYPAFREYSQPRETELQLIKTAAPPSITDRATLKVLTQTGFQITREGSNGFTCVVMRAQPRAPS